MRVQALERRAAARRRRGSWRARHRRRRAGPPASSAARSAATRASARGAAAAQRRTLRELALELGDAAARLELADGAHEHAAGEPERRRKRHAGRVVGALGDHARPAVRRSARPRRRGHAAAGRAGARSPRGHAASRLPRAEVWQPGGAPAQTAKPCRCRLAPASVPQRASAPRPPPRRRRAAAAARRALHRPGALVPARALRDAAAARRGRAARPRAREAAGRLRSASRTTAMIAQARAQGYIRPGEKPFALTP